MAILISWIHNINT